MRVSPVIAADRIPRRRRFLRVVWFFIRLVAHILWFDVVWGRSVLYRWRAERTRIARYRRFAHRFRDLAIDLGGVMIKLGQFASTRVDILPPAIVEDLIGLQDEVPPVDFAAIRAALESELGEPIAALFVDFDPEPVAAASFGQVHRAHLADGTPVAVKVQRPLIEEYVQIDLSALRWVASWMQYYGPIRRRTNLPAIIEEFARITLRELDYLSEADHADRFRRNFAANPVVAVPVMYRERSSQRVLTMEWIEGIKLSDHAGLDAAHIDRLTLAETLYLTYLQQCFTDGFFHADPHPGNLFVRPLGERAADGSQPFTLTFLDFGMVDEVTPRVMDGLAQVATGVVLRDAQRMIDGSRQVGTLIADVNEAQLRQAIEVWFSYTYGRTIRELQEVDVEGLVGGLGDILYDLPFQLPQSLLFLGRALSVVGGVAAGLAPDFDIFATTRPYVLRFMRERNTGARLRERLVNEGREWLADVTQLPHLATTFLSRAARGDLKLSIETQRVESSMRGLERAVLRLAAAVVGTGIGIGNVLLAQSQEPITALWWLAGGLCVWALMPRPAWFR